MGPQSQRSVKYCHRRCSSKAKYKTTWTVESNRPRDEIDYLLDNLDTCLETMEVEDTPLRAELASPTETTTCTAITSSYYVPIAPAPAAQAQVFQFSENYCCLPFLEYTTQAIFARRFPPGPKPHHRGCPNCRKKSKVIKVTNRQRGKGEETASTSSYYVPIAPAPAAQAQAFQFPEISCCLPFLEYTTRARFARRFPPGPKPHHRGCPNYRQRKKSSK
jgi:hypothetical protein